mmetsp:Transcript_5563/g.13570  ORF Transcript_5563/g.13570 Transcript_5563/m.13570 type:complete len:83 (+) Transcript_5563:179-427(+)
MQRAQEEGKAESVSDGGSPLTVEEQTWLEEQLDKVAPVGAEALVGPGDSEGSQMTEAEWQKFDEFVQSEEAKQDGQPESSSV